MLLMKIIETTIAFYAKAKYSNKMPGEMAEWLKAAVLKTVISSDRDRGFESLSLLHII